jgi:hypothetical protein
MQKGDHIVRNGDFKFGLGKLMQHHLLVESVTLRLNNIRVFQFSGNTSASARFRHEAVDLTPHLKTDALGNDVLDNFFQVKWRKIDRQNRLAHLPEGYKFPVDTIMRKAREEVHASNNGGNAYDLISNNCESVVTRCVTGNNITKQVPKWISTSLLPALGITAKVIEKTTA